MREEHERDERESGELEFGAAAPNEGEAKAGQCDGQVVVHEAHVEDIAVGEHGEKWREEPRRAARGGGDESKAAPEEEEDAKSDSDFFGGGNAEEIGERKEEEIEDDVFPLPDGIEAGGSSLLDELGKPGVVDVAAEITGFDVGVPEDGDEEEGGEEDGAEFHRNGESIARVGWKCGSGVARKEKGEKRKERREKITHSSKLGARRRGGRGGSQREEEPQDPGTHSVPGAPGTEVRKRKKKRGERKRCVDG